MQYTISFQERPSSESRPIEDGRDVHIEANNKEGFALVPNLGDYVHMIALDEHRPAFEGKVTGRLFRYFVNKDGAQSCHVNVIVDSSEEVPDLIKE